MRAKPLPERQCPWCGADVDESDGPDPSDQPQAGAASCCYSCGRLSIFTALPSGRLGLRRATLEEAEAISGLPEVAAMLALIRADPLRRMPRGPDQAEPVVRRWRDQVLLTAVPFPIDDDD